MPEFEQNEVSSFRRYAKIYLTKIFNSGVVDKQSQIHFRK